MSKDTQARWSDVTGQITKTKRYLGSNIFLAAASGAVAAAGVVIPLVTTASPLAPAHVGLVTGGLSALMGVGTVGCVSMIRQDFRKLKQLGFRKPRLEYQRFTRPKGPASSLQLQTKHNG